MLTPIRQRPITAITKPGGLIMPKRPQGPQKDPWAVEVDWLANADNTTDLNVTIFDENCIYFGSFGPSFFNVRFLGEIQPKLYPALLVTIPGIGTSPPLPWNGTQLRYQGNWTDIQPNLVPLRGTSSTVSVRPT